jgi:chromate reductase
VTVMPNQVAISNGFSAFDDAGALKNEQQSQMLKATLDQLILTTRAMTGLSQKEERNTL